MSAWSLPSLAPLRHGGPDGTHGVRFDFSTNANAAGPLNTIACVVAAADRSRYPDPAYHHLREGLAAWHGATPQRVVVAGSAGEFIHRITHLAARSRRVRRAVVPHPGYGEYAVAASAAGLEVAVHSVHRPRVATADDLWWITEPASPGGQTLASALPALIEHARQAGALVVLDLAYQPLRLDHLALPRRTHDAWCLWSPNKSCGLPGVRAAYAIAPPDDEPLAQALSANAPSWILGAEGVAMLHGFASDAAQAELAAQRRLLGTWRDRLSAVLRAAGWTVDEAASVTPFFVARPPAHVSLAALRAEGFRLRDTASMGLPGRMRLSAQPPQAIDALQRALATR